VSRRKVVVWGTGFVGRMVIPEIVKHPGFELVGVGVSDPAKVGRDVGEICGIGPIGLAATADPAELIAAEPDALVHYGPTAARANDNIRLIRQFLLEGIDPGFANDLFPMTLMGLCSEVRIVRALEILDYVNYTGDYEIEMGIGRTPDTPCLLENRDVLVMAWGATVPMIAHAAGIELDEITTTWEKWVTPKPIRTAKGEIRPGEVAAIHFTINGVYRGETRIQLEHVNRVGRDAAPDWPRGTQDDVYRVEVEGSPSIFQETAFRFTDGSGRDAATAGCMATGLRALNAVPYVNELPPGWVTALDLPLIPGRGTIR
jgi:4-hydroxy-tetrahydrodipicolinate reductase